MLTTITKQYRFEAAHELPNHDGPCQRLHGHSYRIEVALRGYPETNPDSPKYGMVIDFHDVSEVFKRRVFAVCDHQYLNDVLPIPVTTAECIAAWIFEELAQELPVVSVRVWETETGSAQVSGPES